MGDKNLINFEHIFKDYQISEDVTVNVLKDISFSIKSGEFLAIRGPSGSGKSTLMNIIGFLDKPSKGGYFFKDKNITEFDDDQLAQLRNQEIGFIFQTFNLLPRTTVFDNVLLPLLYNNKKNKKQRVLEVLKQVGLSGKVNNFSNQLSGGEMQRVAIARALINEPAIILADEPTGNLDSKNGQQIMEILQDLNEEGHTIILVTHEEDTARHARRILYLKDGELIKDERVANRRKAKDGELRK